MSSKCSLSLRFPPFITTLFSPLPHTCHTPCPSHSSWMYNLLTYSMVQSPSWEANWFAASQEIPRILWNPKVHYRTHKGPPPIPILSQPNPVHIPTSRLLEIQELMIRKKNNYNKLYTVLSYLGVFTFCTCCILICLACIVASFKLSCVKLLLVWSCVLLQLSCVYCCSCLVCIIVVVLCVLLSSYVYFAVLCVYCCFYFRCRTAG